MITTKTVKIEIANELTNEYIESKLKELGYDVLRWAITNFDEKNYTLDVAIVES